MLLALAGIALVALLTFGGFIVCLLVDSPAIAWGGVSAIALGGALMLFFGRFHSVAAMLELLTLQQPTGDDDEHYHRTTGIHRGPLVWGALILLGAIVSAIALVLP